MNIIAMDPSFNNWGYIVASLEGNKVTYKSCGVLHPFNLDFPKIFKKSEVDMWRTMSLQLQLRKLIKQEDPQYIAVELPIGSQSSRAQFSYGVCISTISAICSEVPIVTVTPMEIKKYIGSRIETENEYASKKEIIKWAKERFPLPWKKANGENEHIADACLVFSLLLESRLFHKSIDPGLLEVVPKPS